MGRICDGREKGRVRHVCESQQVWHSTRLTDPLPRVTSRTLHVRQGTYLVDEGHIHVIRWSRGPQCLVE